MGGDNQMKPNLKDFPILRYFRATPYGRRTKKQIQQWKEDFKKKFNDLDAVKWFEDNVYEDWTWEGMLQKFIKLEILGVEAS